MEDGDVRLAPAPSTNSIDASSIGDENKPFRCGVCLDLVYKPIVHACGHVFCFWCVHLAMNSHGRSHCAICRSSYTHFPRICELLHKLLAKDFRKEYLERAKETKAEEDEQSTFSPDLGENDEGVESGSITASSRNDFLCKGCSKFLCRPMVLNCGHVFCQVCIPPCEGGLSKCTSCGFSHRVFPLRVCLELNEYLRATFSAEYEQRDKEEQMVHSCSASEESALPGNKEEAPGDSSSQIHPFAGCDACGVYPISGRRFTCNICNEKKPGYDLCEGCYGNEKSHLIGRFNQAHTRDHEMVEVTPFANPAALFIGLTGEWMDTDSDSSSEVLLFSRPD